MAFYMYREIFFDKVFSKVVKRDNDLALYEGEYHGQIFVPLPHEQVPDDKDRKSILSWVACSDAMGIAGTLLTAMLKGT